MNYEEAMSYIKNLGIFGMNFGLERIEKLCSMLGNPEKKLKVIHVAGTNGKGSVVSYIAEILKSSGYRVGVYTSPHIERFTERIKINDVEIKEEEIANIIEKIKPYDNELKKEGYDHPTEFEIITAAAFLYFYEKEVDYVVLEVGLGGRLDATNVVDPILSVITTISYDHMNVLGNTLKEIASEKAGIIKKDRPVVMFPQEKDVKDVILKKANEMNSKVYLAENIEYEIKSSTIDGIYFNVIGNKKYDNLKINLLGNHQVLNAVTAICAIEALEELGVKISDKDIYEGLNNTKWIGRFEILKKEPYYIVLDGGHNIQGITAFSQAMKLYFKDKKVKMVCGILKDKEYDKMVDTLCSISDYFITVTPDSKRALLSDELKCVFESKGKKAIAANTIDEGVEIALNSINSGEVLAFCGSLYMIGKAREILKYL